MVPAKGVPLLVGHSQNDTVPDRLGTGRAELGALLVTRQQIEVLSRSGYAFLLAGPRGTYRFDLPASLFQELLDQVDAH